MTRYPDRHGQIVGKAKPSAAVERATGGFEVTAAGYAALVAVFAALIAWSPAAGDISLTVMAAGLSSTALALLETARSSRRVGPRRLGRGPRTSLLIGMGVFVVVAVGITFSAVVVGHGAYAAGVAGVTFGIVCVGTFLSEQGARPAIP